LEAGNSISTAEATVRLPRSASVPSKRNAAASGPSLTTRATVGTPSGPAPPARKGMSSL
jgi:hypothetical protein